MNREAIWTAFFAKVTGAAGVSGQFTTMSRLLVHHSDIAVDLMPALFVWTPTETHVRKGKGIPRIATLHGEIIFYIRDADLTDTAKLATVNNALDGIEAVFNTPPSKVETLGELVEHVYLPDGQVQIAVGLVQGVSIVTIPFTIVVP